jgi:hypothetical protein
MVKVPLEVKKKLENINKELERMLLTIGEMEMNKETIKVRAADMSQQRAQYWSQVCQEYKLDPTRSYHIEDDGEVKIMTGAEKDLIELP